MNKKIARELLMAHIYNAFDNSIDAARDVIDCREFPVNQIEKTYREMVAKGMFGQLETRMDDIVDDIISIKPQKLPLDSFREYILKEMTWDYNFISSQGSPDEVETMNKFISRVKKAKSLKQLINLYWAYKTWNCDTIEWENFEDVVQYLIKKK